MLKLIIVDDEGRRTVVPFIRQEITIGRQEGNTIRLTERNVSRHHARLLRRNGSIVVEDLGSYNGVRVNGERIEGSVKLQGGDRIQIGDYELAIDDGAAPVAHDRIPTRELEILPGAKTSPGIAPPKPGSASASEHTVQQSSATRERSNAEAATAAADAPRLIVLNTELAGLEFPCLGTDLKVGRSPDNDIVLDHESLSPTQARLMRESSGEWQIIDLESSNGVFVNGQSFGVARLRDGDTVKLGEVKLKFAAADEVKQAVPPLSSGARRGNRSLVAAVLLLAVAVGAAYFLTRKESTAPPVVDRRAPSEPAPPTAEAEPAPAPARTPAPLPPELLDDKLRQASVAMVERDFKKAIDILQSIKNEDGSSPEQVTAPLARANAELSAEKMIDSAKKSLAAGNLDEARQLLRKSAGTVAFAKEHAKLQARAEALSRALPRKKERDLKLARVSKPKPPAQPSKPAAAEADQDPAEKLYQEGTGLYRKGQYTDAAGALNQCLKVNPAFAKCHMALASTYAKLKEPELGAQHYRRFIQLAPDDPQAARVKLLLEQYESSKELTR